MLVTSRNIRSAFVNVVDLRPIHSCAWRGRLSVLIHHTQGMDVAVDNDIPCPTPHNPHPVTIALRHRTTVYDTLVRKQPDSSGEHLLNIDLELKEIGAALATFRRQRNALVPVARLPPETMSDIFHVVRELDPSIQPPEEYDGVASGYSNIGLGWIKVTQVCHAWREIAFDDSRLWTKVSTLLGKDWFRKMLHLAKYRPSLIQMRVDGELSSTFPELSRPGLLDNVSQVYISSTEDSDLSALADWKAPSVKSLHVHSRFDQGTHGFPTVLFGGAVSGLRELYVHNSVVSLSAPFIHGLTHLSLSTYHDNPAFALQYKDVARTLRGLNGLQSFTMQFYALVVSDQDIQTDAQREIICPQLSYVNVYAHDWPGVVLLMTQLQYSTSAHVTFNTQFPHPDSRPNGTAVLDLFKRRMLCSVSSPVRDMQTVECRGSAPHAWRDEPSCQGPAAPCYPKSIIIAAWCDNDPSYLLSDYEGHTCPPPKYRIILGINPIDPPHRLQEVLPFAAFAAVRCFSVRPVSGMPFEVSYDHGWSELFRAAQMLEWLRVDRGVGEDMLSGAHARHSYPTYNPSNPFPKTLVTMAMLGIRWYYNWGGQTDHTVHHMLNDIGQICNIRKVIVGTASDQMTLEWSNASLSVVERPDWLTTCHPDWDQLTDS